MSNAPDRARHRAPWIALLLVPLLALTGALLPATASTALDGAAVTATVTAASEADGLSVRVTGSGFDGITGAYAAIIEKGTEASVGMSGGYAAFGYWMTPGAIVDGAFDAALVAPTASLDRATQYEFLVWQGHTAPDETTIYARTDLSVTDAQWDAIFPPPPPPAYGISVDASDVANGTVSVSGTFPASYQATNGTTQATGVYLMYCVQPTGTPGVDASGRASGAANCNSPAQQWLVQPGSSWASMGATAIGAVDAGVWTFTSTFPVASTFGARTCLDAATAASGAVPCGIAVRLDHNSGSGANATYTYDRFVPVTVPAATPSPAVTATVTAADAASGLTVRAVGTNFAGITGAYAAIIVAGTEAQVTASDGYAAFGYWATPGAIVDGAFDKVLTAPTAKLDADADYELIVWQAHTNPGPSTIHARAPLDVSDAQWAAIFPEVEQPGTEEPGTGNPGTTPTPAAGSLSWGVKASFRSYVTGPIASGSISTSGASALLGSYVFPQAGAAQLSGGAGSVSYSGSVRFTGHQGALDLRLSDPRVVIDSPSSATLWLRVNGGTSVPFATLALGAGSTSTSTDATGAVRFADVPATLTASGTGAFSLDGSAFYAAGTALDPVTFVVGSAGSAPRGTVVVASASATKKTANTPDATPPATTGIEVTGEPVEGGEITAEADGFAPNESGILAVIYSTPTVLAENLTADADGRVRWTGTLPRGLTGEHTLTFQGSVDLGVVLDIAVAAELQCTVSDATLVWGFKESFRAYIDGSIANGEWTTDGDVGYATPVFTWAGGSGGADEDGALDVAFTGSVRFTGHGGVLDTTVANPRIVVDGERAVLLLDVHGTTQDGAAVEQSAVEFAELDLDAVTATGEGDTRTWTDVPATLTAAGSAAFGTYPGGEALDPITLTVTAEGCASAPAPTASPEETGAPIDDVATSSGWPLWATILIVVLVLLAIAVLVAVLLRRRRA